MKAEDIIGSWVSSEFINPDGSIKKRGLVKGKLEIAADGSAIVKVGFLKFKANWTIEDDKLSINNVSSGESVGTTTLVDGALHMLNKEGTTIVYTKA